uniref:ATP synthase complex subunit 8 n=1 Tax=Ophisternon aenigmaticum TaxID=252593 RepID=Q3BEK9_9TELE|nr:ATPase 8 [Ophisternon aenigmaticum]AAR13480.1 ATPase 8 [Ophisternon aenigmaticum]AAR13482.1 ATPase 8 [Ophisternon aenigmaticum]AAR13484.1 ATPase 8 [Ophisternon aenigmaticum]
MPQLNPAPWFAILLFSWFIFLTILPLKTTAYIFPNEPQTKIINLAKTEPWSWPWF